MHQRSLDMKTTTVHLNAPVRNCNNCAHSEKSFYGLRCVRGGYLCETMRALPDGNCDINMSGWQPKPRRRSLRQFLYDILWR